MVKSEKIYSPQNYLEAVTSKCYIITGENDIELIQEILVENGYGDELWDYPLSEINHIVENDLDVVLVDCMVVNPETDKFEHQYRWFEVPEDFESEIKTHEHKIMVALLDDDYYTKHHSYPEEYHNCYAHKTYVFNTPQEFIKKWYELDEGAWYWVFVNGNEILSGAVDPDDIETFEEYFNMNFEEEC